MRCILRVVTGGERVIELGERRERKREREREREMWGEGQWGCEGVGTRGCWDVCVFWGGVLDKVPLELSFCLKV